MLLKKTGLFFFLSGFCIWAQAMTLAPMLVDSSCWLIHEDNLPLLDEKLIALGKISAASNWNERTEGIGNQKIYFFESACEDRVLCNLQFFISTKNVDDRKVLLLDRRIQMFGFWRQREYSEMSSWIDKLLAQFDPQRTKNKECSIAHTVNYTQWDVQDETSMEPTQVGFNLCCARLPQMERGICHSSFCE